MTYEISYESDGPAFDFSYLEEESEEYKIPSFVTSDWSYQLPKIIAQEQ